MGWEEFIEEGEVRISYAEMRGINYRWKSRTSKSNEVGMSQEVFMNSNEPYLTETEDSEVGSLKRSSTVCRGLELQEGGIYFVEPPERLEEG